LDEGDIIKFGRVRFRVRKIGNTRRKRKHRFNQYDVSLDVSMNERLISEINRRRRSRRDTHNSFDSSMFQANAAVNQSTQQEKITEKIAKIVRTSGEHDFKKVRREAQCRICLGEEEDDEVEENPLISPCKCNGTMQYIHLECLKKWLDSKIHTKLTPYTFSYNWKNLVCEL
jgi:predicted Zn-ribbon and HTH transcriptional regulator